MNENSQSTQAYPTSDLARALQVGEAVHNYGGARAGVDKSQIAAHLKLSETSSTFAAIMASARSFGIVTGRRDYMLTTNADNYFAPSSESMKRQAMLAFFASPPAFAKLVDKFDGTKLPAGEYLANVFSTQCKVGKSWAGRVAAIFTKAAEMAGAIDSEGYLRFKAATKNATTQNQAGGGAPTTAKVAEQLSDEVAAPRQAPTRIQTETNVWVYTLSGKTVRLETPHDLPGSLWQKLSQYVEILKPSEEKENT